MICLSVGAFPCGKCKACRVNHKRKWTARCILESYLHPATWFVTLTYAPEHFPEGGSVDPRHLQLFLKRLRFALGVDRVRYFAVGEYGSRTWRPHYHLTLYGPDRGDMQELVHEAWGLGFTVTRLATAETLAYVAQYTLKKMTKAADERLQGRHPEFVRMSRRPGIGAGAAEKLALLYRSEAGRKEFMESGAMQRTFRVDGRLYPFDRYMRDRMSRSVGLSKEDFDPETWEILKRLDSYRRFLTPEEKAVKRAQAEQRSAVIYRKAEGGLL